MTDFFLSQVLVSIAICFDMVSFQFKDRKEIIACLFVAGILISIHFALLEQWTASGLMAISTIRYFTSIFTTSKKIASIFIASSLLATYFTFTGLVSLLSCAGSLFQTTAAFSKNDKTLRVLMIVGTSFWLLHNYVVQSPVAVLMEVLFISSNLVGYYRHYIQKPQKISTEI
ncbi:hypothetical protein SOPP22_10850 [Shewanella sp. OPT22]|nr:hypothetical protein SOPP22_10850 [Shewanella sp. OPT22]